MGHEGTLLDAWYDFKTQNNFNISSGMLMSTVYYFQLAAASYYNWQHSLSLNKLVKDKKQMTLKLIIYF